MEVVECGGVLCKNVRADGVSHAAILFAGEQMRRDLSRCADILGVSLEFLDMDAGIGPPPPGEKSSGWLKPFAGSARTSYSPRTPTTVRATWTRAAGR